MKKLKILILVLMCFLCFGCYDNKELNEIGIVTMMLVKYEDNNYTTYVELLNPKKEAEKSSFFIKGTGKTMEESISNAEENTYLNFDFSHMYTFIYNKEIINNHLNEISDYVIRNNQIRKDLNTYTSEDIDAFLEFKPENDSSVGESLWFIDKNQEKVGSLFYTSDFREILHSRLNKDVFYIGEINIKDESISFDNVYACFDNKAVMTIDKKALLLHSILNKKVKNFKFKDDASYNAYKYKVKTNAKKDEINININVNLRIVNVYNNKITSYKDIKDLEKNASNYLEKIFLDSISYSKEIGYDLYDLNGIYYEYYPKEKTDDSFKKIKVNINVNADINEKGLTLKGGET